MPFVGEVDGTRRRGKIVVLAQNAYYIVAIASEILVSYMLNPIAWDWNADRFLLWRDSDLLFCLSFLLLARNKRSYV